MTICPDTATGCRCIYCRRVIRRNAAALAWLLVFSILFGAIIYYSITG
jgi:hypothetical protein